MDAIQLIRLLHNAPGIDSQYARIYPESKIVEYCFLPTGIFFDHEVGSLYANDFMNGLKSLLDSKYTINLEDKSCVRITAKIDTTANKLEEEFEKLKELAEYENMQFEIKISYQAKNQEEFDQIAEFLRSTPTDSGKLPTKDETFFGYD